MKWKMNQESGVIQYHHQKNIIITTRIIITIITITTITTIIGKEVIDKENEEKIRIRKRGVRRVKGISE